MQQLPFQKYLHYTRARRNFSRNKIEGKYNHEPNHTYPVVEMCYFNWYCNAQEHAYFCCKDI
jgi:hypothetical protein